MQTFLPYADLYRSASTLDWRRLGNQRKETMQILNTLAGRKKGWAGHPAVLMWKGYEPLLCMYGLAMCDEWVRRGYNDNLTPFFQDERRKYGMPVLRTYRTATRPTLEHVFELALYPWWWGTYAFHASHRSNLLAKDPEFYSQYGWAEPSSLPYWWPTEKLGQLVYELT